MDRLEQLQRRCSIAAGTCESIIMQIQDLLLDIHHLVQQFIVAKDNPPSADFDLVIRADLIPAGKHTGGYNLPVASEGAAVISGQEHGKRDVVIHHKHDGLQRIAETNPVYDAMQYPLLYTTGQDCYCFGIAILDSTGNPITRKNVNVKSVLAMSYYACMLIIAAV